MPTPQNSRYEYQLMVDSILLYLGLFLVGFGLLSLIWPVRFFYVRTRAVAAIVLLVGAVLAAAALLQPVRSKQAATLGTKLDEWMPVWQFAEKHEIRVNAPPETAFAAIRAVRAKDILFFRLLTAIRRCGRAGPESVLNAPNEKPLLDVATQTTFLLLTAEPPRELVVGTVIAAPPESRASGKLIPEIFGQRLKPGVVLATMNFLVRPVEGRASIIVSETRVYANDAPAIRRFAIYWRFIHPGSDIIRRMWLRAIKLRAESRSQADAI